jgi:NADPH:quinone reductase-like Zn-dependent oxidoreductase
MRRINMKAIVYNDYGSPDVLRLEEVAKPRPGEDEVLVQVHAVSINSWDWDMLTGKPLEYRLFSGFFKPRHKGIHGCDIAGKVATIGKKVDQFQVGDDVFGDLSDSGWGAFAEYTCAGEDQISRKPAGMTFAEAACLSHGGNLAVQGLIDYGNIQSGQKVLINGGGGSTGTLAIQIAKVFDADLTAVDRVDKFDLMHSLGADHLIDYAKEDFTRNGGQYDLILDVNTTRPIDDYQRALRPNGTYVTVGGSTLRILQLVLFSKLAGRRNLHMVAYKANKDLPYLVDLFETGRLRPVIDRCFPLEKTADAFRYYGEGGFKGKIVIFMG